MPLFMHGQNLHLPEMDGSSSDWQMGMLQRPNFIVYRQPEFTMPASLFCTCLGQQQDHLQRRLLCRVLSVVCPVVWLQRRIGLSS